MVNLFVALCLLLGCAGIAYGAWLINHGAGYITSGFLFIVWTFFVLIDIPDSKPVKR